MKKKLLTLITLCLGLIFLLAACAPKATPVPTEVKATRVVPDPTKPATEAFPATEAPASTAGSSATEVATTVATKAVAGDACVSCHTNKEQLVKLAVEPEETEGESEGVG